MACLQVISEDEHLRALEEEMRRMKDEVVELRKMLEEFKARFE